MDLQTIPSEPINSFVWVMYRNDKQHIPRIWWIETRGVKQDKAKPSYKNIGNVHWVLYFNGATYELFDVVYLFAFNENTMIILIIDTLSSKYCTHNFR